jgi:hypothetical protein
MTTGPRRDPEPEEDMQLHPSVDDLNRMAPQETARGCDQRRLIDTTRLSEALQPPHEIKIFHQRDRTEAAHRLICVAPDKDAGITVVEAEPSDPRVKARQPPAEAGVPIEDKPKVSADHARVRREHLLDRGQRSNRQGAVRMQEEQDVAARHLAADTELISASWRGQDHANPTGARDLGCSVLASAVDDDYLVVGLLATKDVQKTRQ